MKIQDNAERYLLEEDDYYIAHEGRRGQQAGVRHEPYPMDKSELAAMEAEADERDRERKAKSNIKRLSNFIKRRKGDYVPDEPEKKIVYLSKIVESEDLNKIWKYRKYFSDSQIQSLVKRYENLEKLDTIRNKRNAAVEARKHRLRKSFASLVKRGATNIGTTVFDSYTKSIGGAIASDLLQKTKR